MRDQAAINKKISDSLRGRKCGGRPFKKGFDPNRRVFSESDRKKAVEVRSLIREASYAILLWENLPFEEKRRSILREQDGCCLWCLIGEWRGKQIVLELDHIDGNIKNNSRSNLRFLCPNCHSQTNTWRRKKNVGVKGIGIPTTLRT